jgi:putative addiction module CopG family antidote
MTISLPPDLQKLVDDTVREGVYGSPEEVVRAALDQFLRQKDDFGTGELDVLLARGTADIEAGRVHPGKAVFDEIRGKSAAARRGKAS